MFYRSVSKSYWEKCIDMLNMNQQQSSHSSTTPIEVDTNKAAKDQVDQYMNEASVSPDTDPLKFWKLKERVYINYKIEPVIREYEQSLSNKN